MDANGQRFWILAEKGHWPWRSRTQWDEGCGALRLASERRLAPPESVAAAHATANTALERIPRTVDALGAVARWSGEAGAVVARSHLPDEAVRVALVEAPSDVVAGPDGILYLALPDGIRMHDLRGRWDDVIVEVEGFAPWRLAADPAGGVWALERASGRIARLTGRPLTVGPYREYAGTTFRPDPENCHPPALEVVSDGALPAGERAVAVALHPGRGPALLTWIGTEGDVRLRFLDLEAEALGAPLALLDAVYAYALAFVSPDSLVVRAPHRPDAPAYHLSAADAEGSILPAGDVYPLADDAVEAPFAHRVDGPPRYPVELAGGHRGAEPLHKLSLTNLARHGEARHFADGAARLIDSGDQRTVWHRIFAEARIPVGTGFTVWCAATAEPEPPEADRADRWHAHHFGEIPVAEPHAPVAARERAPSELPHHPGLGRWPEEDGRSGLWSVLVQNPRRRVRRVVGRYLWVRVELFGDGRVGPEVVALRAWASRFSYRDQYLPRLYREARHGEPAREPGEQVAALPASDVATLDAGGRLPAPLRERLGEAAVAVGEGAWVRVDRPGEAWLLRDGAGGRAWRLRAGPGGEVGVYRPEATPADFLERLLCSFEGVLTPMEDRIASAHLLTDPATVPDDRLDWLGAWTGVEFDPVLPEDRRRAWLAAAPLLARHHGTRRGLELALEVASGGGVSGGEIVVLEDFRLRRLLATLLGVELEVEDDPLLPGLVVSGNSVVGDTLTLGEAERTELLALFRAEVATEAEKETVRAFYERLAFRATVLVHQEVSPRDLGLLRRVVELESPAHCEVRVVTATWPLLVGVASLVGVDTYLGPRRPRRPARVERSAAGQDFVLAPATVDPRLAGAAAPRPGEPPVADAGPDFTTPFGESFELDGSGSSAPPGRRIDRYRWRRLPPE